MITRRSAIDKSHTALPSGYAGAVLFDGPKAYYRTQSGATVPDASGNGNDASQSGVSLVTGPEGDAFSGFWANPGLITLPDSLLINGDESITIEMLYKVASGAVSSSAFTIGNTPAVSSARCQAHMPYAGTLYWDYGDWSSVGRLSIDMTPYEDDAWHHIALVVDAHNPFSGDGSFYKGRMQIWIDAVKVAEDNWIPYLNGGDPSAQFVGGDIGNWPASSGTPTQGEIAEFAVFDKVLSSSRIAAHFAAL